MLWNKTQRTYYGYGVVSHLHAWVHSLSSAFECQIHEERYKEVVLMMAESYFVESVACGILK